MIAVEIQVKGIEALRAKWGAGMIRGRTTIAMHAVMKQLQEDMRYYPPRQNKEYVRTYRLRRNWLFDVQADAGGVTGVLHNRDTPYVRWVQDRITQTQIHADTPWQTIQDVAKNRRRFILDTFSQHFAGVVQGSFSGINAARGE